MILFKALKKIPLPIGAKSFLFQIYFGLLLFALVSFLGWSKISFVAGFLFSYLYMILFFYSAKLLFEHGKRKLGLTLMGVKWILLLLTLLGVGFLLQGKSFLMGLSAAPSFWLFYAFESFKKKFSCHKSKQPSGFDHGDHKAK